MPFTKKQLHNITQSRGQAYIARDRGNYSMRVSETYIRRKLYNWEDKTIRKEYDLFQQASKDIQYYGLNIAHNTYADVPWKKAVLQYAETRLARLAWDVTRNAIWSIEVAYYAGYVGRLWVLDSMTTSEAPINKARIQAKHKPDADDLRQQYDTALMQGVVKLRGRAIRAVIDEMPIAQAVKFLADFGQHNDQPADMFYSMQIVTRSAVMRASNYGAYDAFMAQAQPQTEAVASDRDWVLGMMWLSQRDGRVCPTCQARDGTTWLLSELWGIALTEFPPDNSHLGCRCTVIFVVLPNLLKDENEPPDLTFDEWIDENGYHGLIDEFADETQLASTQI